MATQSQTITNVSGQNQLSAEDKTFYERTLLQRLLPQLNFYNDAEKKKLPKNSGTTMNFRKFNSLTAPSSSLTEGVTPDGNNLSITTFALIVVIQSQQLMQKLHKKETMFKLLILFKQQE